MIIIACLVLSNFSRKFNCRMEVVSLSNEQVNFLFVTVPQFTKSIVSFRRIRLAKCSKLASNAIRVCHRCRDKFEPFRNNANTLSLSCLFEKFFMNFSCFSLCVSIRFLAIFFTALFALVICFVPCFYFEPPLGWLGFQR